MTELRLALHPKNRTLRPVQLPFLECIQRSALIFQREEKQHER